MTQAADPRKELVEERGEFKAVFLGEKALEDREPNEVFTLYIPDIEDWPVGRLRRHALARQVVHDSLADRPRVAFELLRGNATPKDKQPPTPGTDEDRRPRQIRVYVLEDKHTLLANYYLDGERRIRKVALDLPFHKRSTFMTRALESLYFITVPVDIVLAPDLIPVLILIAWF